MPEVDFTPTSAVEGPSIANLRSRATPLRVLLVHANPFQRVVPVPPYGLERIKTAAESLGAVVRILDPYLIADDAISLAAREAQEMQPDVIGLGIRILDDCIPVDTPAASDSQHDVTWFLPEIRALRRALGEAVPSASFVLGGAGFSVSPQECLDYLGVDFGIVGAGEDAFCSYLSQLDSSHTTAGIDGGVHRGTHQGIDSYALSAGSLTDRDPLYGPVNSFPIRTRIGCAMQCVYCTAANLLRRHSRLDLEAVLDEIESVVRLGGDRGIHHVPLFFADDEWNLPDDKHPMAILHALVSRNLHKHLKWRAYFNPIPLSDELCELALETNGHLSITVDSASDTVLARSQKPFRRRHLDALVARLARYGVPADIGLIFGLPGESEDTLTETLEFVRELPSSIDVYYSTGARVYPHTPLARIARTEPHHLVGSDPTFFAPVIYSSPWPPRALATYLMDMLRDSQGVRHVSVVSYRNGRTTVADSYRVLLRKEGREAWDVVLDRAEEPGDVQRSPVENLLGCLQTALWHSRFDLAAQACRRIVIRSDLPEGVSRWQLRVAYLTYRTLGALDRFTEKRELKEVA